MNGIVCYKVVWQSTYPPKHVSAFEKTGIFPASFGNILEGNVCRRIPENALLSAYRPCVIMPPFGAGPELSLWKKIDPPVKLKSWPDRCTDMEL